MSGMVFLGERRANDLRLVLIGPLNLIIVIYPMDDLRICLALFSVNLRCSFATRRFLIAAFSLPTNHVNMFHGVT